MSLPSLHTPWAAVPAGRLPVVRFRIAVGREAVWPACDFFVGVVTMLVLVTLARSLTPCANAGWPRKAKSVIAARTPRMLNHRKEELSEMSQVHAQKQEPSGGRRATLGSSRSTESWKASGFEAGQLGETALFG